MPAPSLMLGEAVALAILQAFLGDGAKLLPADTRVGQIQRHAAAAALRQAGFPACAAQQPQGSWAVLSSARALALLEARPPVAPDQLEVR
ncbi:hypothetical protein [Teichococcus cervicalis]|uniref:Uncharacterized protein n=2 Tax=Teichococcus cervicalis TaxID=204525 RepID=D5RM58_9PROT|nr:hypothetical protein HMPREF0731_2169 [Pseudoroseomonas cervicalis ATCC 49957]